MIVLKINELSIQLKGLLDQGFMQPSVSPWVCQWSLWRKRMETLGYVFIIEIKKNSAIRNGYHMPRIDDYLTNQKELQYFPR